MASDSSFMSWTFLYFLRESQFLGALRSGSKGTDSRIQLQLLPFSALCLESVWFTAAWKRDLKCITCYWTKEFANFMSSYQIIPNSWPDTLAWTLFYYFSKTGNQTWFLCFSAQMILFLHIQAGYWILLKPNNHIRCPCHTMEDVGHHLWTTSQKPSHPGDPFIGE